MNELFNLIRQHYEKNEAGTSLVSKVTTILDSLPEGSVDSSQLAGLDQFHVMGLAATEQLAQIAGIERGATILDAGSGLGRPSFVVNERSERRAFRITPSVQLDRKMAVIDGELKRCFEIAG